MMLDTDKIKQLVNSDEPVAKLSKEAELGPTVINHYRKGGSEFDNMSLKTAKRLMTVVNKRSKERSVDT